jgi:hypothetical protein
MNDAIINRDNEILRCEKKLEDLKKAFKPLSKNHPDYKSKKLEIIKLKNHIEDMKQRNGVLKSFYE